MTGFFQDLSACELVVPGCAVHAKSTAVASCSGCGRPLCVTCAPAEVLEPRCPACGPSLRTGWLSFRRWLSPSLSGLWILIGFLLIAYVVFSAHRFSAFGRPGVVDEVGRTQRCRLYMTKAARSDFYGQALEREGRPDLARRRYRMAIQATQQVLGEAAQTVFWKDLSADERLETESRLRLALAKYHVHCGELEQARTEIERVLASKPPPPIVSLALFRKGESLEGVAPLQAIRAYQECQPAESALGPDGDSFDRLINAASLNPDTRQFFLMATGLSDRFDAAEAQVRLMACYEKMGDRLQAEVAYGVLLERYPYSPQAERLKKERGEPKAADKPPPLPFRKQPQDGPPDETITIVPLE